MDSSRNNGEITSDLSKKGIQIHSYFCSNGNSEKVQKKLTFLQKKIKSKYLASIIDVGIGKNDRILVLSESLNWNLKKELQNKKKLSEDEVGKYAFQILTGLNCLKLKENFAHRNLNLETIQLDEQRNIKLQDWSQFYATNFGITIANPIGIIEYMAPEVIAHPVGFPTLKADIWSLGIIMFELISGELFRNSIFQNESNLNGSIQANSSLLNQIVNLLGYQNPSMLNISEKNSPRVTQKKDLAILISQQDHFDCWLDSKLDTNPQISKDLKSVLRNCLIIDPSERPSIEELLDHSFFDKYKPVKPNQIWVQKPFFMSSLIYFDENGNLEYFNHPLLFEKQNESSTPKKESSSSSSQSQAWFFDSITRAEAEKILKNCDRDSFLIRPSSTPGNYAISLYFSKTKSVTHTLISNCPGGFYLEGRSRIYSTLQALIEKSPELTGLFPPKPFLNASVSSNSVLDSPLPPSSSSQPMGLDETYLLWKGSAIMDLESNLTTLSRDLKRPAPILNLPVFMSVKKTDKTNFLSPNLFSEQRVVIPLQLFRSSRAVPLQNKFENMQKYPLKIRENDINYQKYRVQLFKQLLSEYPQSRESIILEAKVDIPPALRAEIWCATLGVPSNTQEIYDSIDKESEGVSDKQIELDIPRCHQYHSLISSFEGQKKLKRILKCWVKANYPNLVYWQGLDSVLAPFLVLNFNDEAKAYYCLQVFVEKYLHNFYLPENHLYLQETLQIFTQLLAYHDPELALHLLNTGFKPDLFAISWFLTLFSHVLPIDKVYKIWDRYLVGPSFTYFMAIAILSQFRKELLSLDFNGCILFFSNLKSINVEQCIHESEKMVAITPLKATFSRYLLDKSNLRPDAETGPMDYNQLAPLLSLQDLVQSEINLIPIDIRPSEEFTLSNVKNSINFPLKKEINLEPLEKFRGEHLVIISRTIEESIQFANMLVRKLFPCISILGEMFENIPSDFLVFSSKK